MSGGAIDTKFDELPWIAHGQPDVYESGELPESEQYRLQSIEQATGDLPPEIDAPSLNLKDAVKVFENMQVDAQAADFANSKGYNLALYEILPENDRKHETLMQRFQRIQTEVRSLSDDASKLSDNLKTDPEQPITAAQLIKLTDALSDQLNGLQLEQMLGPAAELDVNCPEAVLLRQMKDKIASFKTSAAKSTEEGSTPTKIVYELHHGVDRERTFEQQKLADLHLRLERLENLVGTPDPSRLSALTADTTHHSLMEAANRLSARSSLLRSENLEQIDARLNELNSKLKLITEHRSAIANADTQNKVAELYELVKKWHGVSTNLPRIVKRMTELKELHEQAANFSGALVRLEQEQGELDTAIKQYRGILDHVDKNFASSMQTIQNNVTKLESRFTS